MNESKAVVSTGWSSLTTVDDFDMGLSKKNMNIIHTAQDISTSTAKSLFIESLVDQICKLLEKDPIKRQIIYQAMCNKLYRLNLIDRTYIVEELAPLRGFYQQALIEAILSPETRLLVKPSIKFGSSRYAIEFEEIGFLASGGFGKVFKAKNKLDQVIYAVKKIPLKYHSITAFQKKLNEVKTLAKLNHSNIVQYKAAWLEPLFETSPTIQSPENTVLSSNDSDIVVFQSQSPNTGHPSTQQELENNKAICKFGGKDVFQIPIPKISALLYVTMQLRDGTLSEWLLKRNSENKVDQSVALYIMLEAVKGVEYMHSCNIVHHDIKPRNIFVSSNLKAVEVGDFGLSCLHEFEHENCPLQGGQFGTPLYAAPEQLKGCCDSKSDMFSLGLVFVELLTIFSTEMEKVKVLTSARSGELPPSIPLKLKSVIKSLLSRKPSKRPTATELSKALNELKFNETVSKLKKEVTEKTNLGITSSITTLNSNIVQGENEILSDKDREIMELRRMLAQKDSEIAYLKLLVNQSYAIG
ncbi:hypothetical protein RUM44_005117 [Polyplax serrata]|uniref:non-specific serine/threonine protein kinase n=1 Tax=Polyplax serrata TaxID=468196 RepID=A0ABR1AE34_POLSC